MDRPRRGAPWKWLVPVLIIGLVVVGVVLLLVLLPRPVAVSESSVNKQSAPARKPHVSTAHAADSTSKTTFFSACGACRCCYCTNTCLFFL